MCQGNSHFSGFLHHFVLAKLATNSITVKQKSVKDVFNWAGDSCIVLFCREDPAESSVPTTLLFLSNIPQDCSQCLLRELLEILLGTCGKVERVFMPNPLKRMISVAAPVCLILSWQFGGRVYLDGS